MELVRYEISVGLIKGILIGMREYDYKGQIDGHDVVEKDITFYLGMCKLTITLIYN